MTPKTIATTAAIGITALFLAVVGVVLIVENLPTREQRQARDRQVVANDFFAPLPVEEPMVPMPDFEQPVLRQELRQEEIARVRGDVMPAKEYVLSEPITHGNLTVFMIRGENKLKDQKILTLQEGIEQGVAVVHDRGTLFVDNRGKTPLFIQAGDIVKGGNQDRTLPYDMLVPPQSNMVQIPSLCVEQGRSRPRGKELSSSFQTSTQQLPGRSLRAAAYKNAQQEVWNNVQNMQTNLTRNIGGSVRAAQSESSLQLTLEHPKVQTAVQEYLAKLGPATQDKDDVIGYVAVVNGRIQSADVYASSELFQKLWFKLLRASAIEAISEGRAAVVDNVPNAEAVRAFLTGAEQGSASRVQMAGRSTVIRQESNQQILHDTCIPNQENLVLHRSFLAK